MVPKEGRKIFLKNLGKKFVYEDFKEKVEKFGEVSKFLNSGRGYCFLTFSTAEAAAACIATLNNTMVAGKTLQMNIAKEKPAPATEPTTAPTPTPAPAPTSALPLTNPPPPHTHTRTHTVTHTLCCDAAYRCSRRGSRTL